MLGAWKQEAEAGRGFRVWIGEEKGRRSGREDAGIASCARREEEVVIVEVVLP